MIPSTQAQLKMIPFWRLKMIHHHSARVLHLRLKIQPGMTTAWRHAHPANQRPVLKACLKHQTPDRLISFQQKQGEGGRKELNKKRFPGNLWTLEALGICGHWEIYKHRHWKLWDLLTLGNTNTDTGSSENLRTLGNTNTDTGSSGNLRTLGNTNTSTHVHECTHRDCYTNAVQMFTCTMLPTSTVHHVLIPDQHYSTIIRHTYTEYKEDGYHNSQMRGNNTSTIKRLLHLGKNTSTKTHYCESVYSGVHI